MKRLNTIACGIREDEIQPSRSASSDLRSPSKIRSFRNRGLPDLFPCCRLIPQNCGVALIHERQRKSRPVRGLGWEAVGGDDLPTVKTLAHFCAGMSSELS